MATPVDPNQFTVAKIFTPQKLAEFKTSDLVKSFTPTDFADMTKEFSIPRQQTGNKKVSALTSEDLVSIDGLFSDYRQAILANYRDAHAALFQEGVTAQSSCCCCCTPCCSCSAASQTQPFAS